MADLNFLFVLVLIPFCLFPYQAGSHTACGRLQPPHTAAGMTSRERTEALVGLVVVEEPELSHSP